MERNEEKIILFDCFGLFAQDSFIAFFTQQYGQEKGKELKDHFCVPADLGQVDLDGIFANMANELHRSKDEIRKTIKTLTKVNPEMIEKVIALRTFHPVYLLSNCIPGILEWAFEGTRFPECFDGEFRSYELQLAKPSLAYFEYVKKALSPTASLLFFDDNPKNVEAAKQAGIDAELFTSIEEMEKALLKRGFRIH